jgi:predicted membrane-bound mannosyltransferase
VEGADGLTKLAAKIKTGGPLVLWHGSLGAMGATFVGHYPWFYTYNFLNASVPQYDRKTELPKYLARNAFLGAHRLHSSWLKSETRSARSRKTPEDGKRG